MSIRPPKELLAKIDELNERIAAARTLDRHNGVVEGTSGVTAMWEAERVVAFEELIRLTVIVELGGQA